MRQALIDEINRIGQEDVAKSLHTASRDVMDRIEHPEAITLKELDALCELGFSNKMIILMLENLKRGG